MSVVIVGGNECMVRQYKDLCESYSCRFKIIPKVKGSISNKIGSPDLLVLFTNTVSHKMLKGALTETKGQDTVVVRSHSSSIAALKKILEEHAK